MNSARKPDAQRSADGRSPIRVVIVVGSGETLVDVFGPYQVFLRASSIGAASLEEDIGRYQVEIVSPGPEPVVASRRGLALRCNGTLRSLEGKIDTVIVAAADIERGKPVDSTVVEWLRQHASAARRVASVCSGAFFLAEAGLLDGRRATTHWRYVERLAERYPAVTVEADPIYVRDGNIYTSAGMTSGMDLALALVEEDYGSEVARAVARSMVIYMHRPGGQAQFSAALRRQAAAESPIKRVQEWVIEHLEEPLSVDRLSEIAGMSPRNFARVFLREAGTTPAKYVEELRLEEARRMLESGNDTVERVAELCGFGSTDSLQRHFSVVYATSPSEYRSRFQTALRT